MVPYILWIDNRAKSSTIDTEKEAIMSIETKKYNHSLVTTIKEVILESRKKTITSINHQLVRTYWHIGKIITENEKAHGIDGQSVRQHILELSKELTKELGKGFSRSNLFNMRKFYLEYPDVQTVSGRLSWSHICELLTIEDQSKREFYKKETINSLWSFRELKRQINSSLYERLLLSSAKTTKEKILELSQKGQKIEKPTDILKNPYVLEFLGMPEKKLIKEKELERKLVRHIEDFLLEMGRGFMFVGSQERMTINNTHYYVDMVFYNEIAAEYILSGFENKVFASQYTYVLPKKEDLVQELEHIIHI